MKEHTDMQKELEGMGSSLAGMSRQMPYSVPEGYFDQLSDNITDSLKNIKTDTGTFDGSRIMPYTGVPAGYFDQLPAQMLALAKAESDKQTQIIDIAPKKRLLSIKRINWAVAAVLLITIGIGGYTFLFRQGDARPDKLLSSVPNNELHEYLQSTCRIDVDRVVNNNTLINLQLDNKDIINYLDETGWDVVD